MTLDEFIEYLMNLKERGYGDYWMTVGYRDSGGYYSGSDDVKECNIELNDEEKTIEL